MKTSILFFISLISSTFSVSQYILKGNVSDGKAPVEFVNVYIPELKIGGSTDDNGNFEIKNLPKGKFQIELSSIGYLTIVDTININSDLNLFFKINSKPETFDEVVISGTMKEVSKLDSPVPIEVYTANFFKSNPEPSIFESIQQVNGVRPQLNCNVCNTGDIHINGLEGPYTMVLIDGMPIVSGLSTVYGLSGIPQSLIERVEIIKGPSSTLFGSEAVGGVINIITKKAELAPIISTEIYTTSWGEINTDLALKFKPSNKSTSLLGINYFNYNLPIDKNGDNFTDLTLQNRISIFNKWSFKRKNNKLFSIAGRYNYEDRWGGELNWNKEFRGGDSIYGESIYTNRWELFGVYQLPSSEDIRFQFSGNGHYQNSVYGDMAFVATQQIGFSQLVWNKLLKNHDITFGAAYKYIYYDDNTVATQKSDTTSSSNNPSINHLPGLFIQNEWNINAHHKLLTGVRYELNSLHGQILSPRFNYKWNSKEKNSTLRLSFGNGYRVVNIFTEDHAALTGAREVVIEENLSPERSWNGNINFVQKFYIKNKHFLNIDASVFYTYFSNRIIADYETDVNKIIYDNLKGHGESKGLSLNIDLSLSNGFKFILGGTLQDVSIIEENIRTQQILTENFSGVWNIGYEIQKWGISIDYTGKIYSPMRLPLLGELDNRSSHSPWFSLQNIQFTKRTNGNWEFFGGVKNILNYTPPANSIARAFDPFDRNVAFDGNGSPIATPDNPNALTFDPSYVYASNQGIRFFLGIRFSLYKKATRYELQ